MVRGKQAYAVGVHIAGNAKLGTNSGVPICFHAQTKEKIPDKDSIDSRSFPASQGRIKCTIYFTVLI